MGSSADIQLASLETFLKSHPNITYATPSSPNYDSLREIFCLDCKAVPLAIVRPQTAEDVSLLVKYAKSQGIKFVVRTGGHSLFGYSMADGAMTIDLRDISHVKVEEGKLSAKIGGGTLLGDIATQLLKHGLVTPTGTVPSVGYVGWAIYGGYGPLSPNFGLGADQILGAKIVNWKGEIVDADEKLLKGIRGAGGIFGIITEMTIKVYPLKNIFAGNLIYDSSDIKTMFTKFNTEYQKLSAEGLPTQLSVQQMVVNSPHGRLFGIGFMWSSEDVETGQIWVKKFESLGTVIMNTVAVTTIPVWLNAIAAMCPTKLCGQSRTHNLRHITEEVSEIIGSGLEIMPSNPATMFSIHELRGPSVSLNEESVFGTRVPHFMLEILGCALKEEDREECLQWGNNIWKAIHQTDRDNILPTTYISLDPPGESPGQIPLSKIFGSNYLDVLALKQEYDSKNTFDLAVPRLNEHLHD